jgi:hypothetical protein
MPEARAIRFKSGLTPANALRAFCFYPYCISITASPHIVKPHFPLPLQSPPISAVSPARCEEKRFGSESPTR